MMKNKKLFYGVLLIVIVLIGGWWIWNNFFTSSTYKLNETIEGVFYRVPTDPSAFVVGFRACDGSEYYIGVDVYDFTVLNKDGSIVKGTYGLVNPVIGSGEVKMHGYEPFTTQKVDNLIKDVDKIILLSDCECIPSTGFLRKEVTITTDKTEYEQGETVIIILKNKGNNSVYYPIDPCCVFDADIKLQKYQDKKWIETTKERENLGCHTGPCIGCLELKKNDEKTFKVSFEFKPSTKYRFKLNLRTECKNGLDFDESIFEVFSNEFTIKEIKGICGPIGMGPNYDTSYCDRSCNTDNDCKFTCGCGAINKNEICHDEGIIYGCVGHETKCEKSKCVIGEEMLPAE